MSTSQPARLHAALSAKELDEVFHALDELEPEGSGAQRRQHPRYCCRELEQVVLVLEPDIKHKRTAHRVIPNDLSNGGASVLVLHMLYPDTRCALMLQNLQGRFVAIRGSVRRCRFITRRVHEVSVVFSEPISVADFLLLGEQEPAEEPSGTAAEGTAEPGQPQNTDPPAEAA